MLRHWSQFVPNMSTDIRGHQHIKQSRHLILHCAVIRSHTHTHTHARTHARTQASKRTHKSDSDLQVFRVTRQHCLKGSIFSIVSNSGGIKFYTPFLARAANVTQCTLWVWFHFVSLACLPFLPLISEINSAIT